MKNNQKNKPTKPKNIKLPSLLIPLILVCFGLLPMAQAVSPAPDGGYPGGNTAEGQNALLSLITGTYNTAVGVFSLESLTTGKFCTGVGAATLLANTADENTATGAGALLSNRTGFDNTANGAFALFTNTVGFFNTATGARALFSNTSGSDNTATGTDALRLNTEGNSNTAYGVSALASNTTGQLNTASGAGALLGNTEGNSNTASGVSALTNNTIGQSNTTLGANALLSNTVGNGNVAVGFEAGADLTDNNNINIGVQVRGLPGETNTIRIGDNLPRHNESNCYIGGVFDSHVGDDAFAIGVNVDNKIGDTFVPGPQKLRIKDILQAHKKVAELEVTVAALSTQLKEQAARIEKVSSQLEMAKSTKKVVLNNQ